MARQTITRLARLLPVFPGPHFMAFAPLDAWARVLFSRAGAGSPAIARIGWRYWPRLAFTLFTSCLGTALSLPERVLLAPVLAVRRRRVGGRFDHEPGVVCVLGYYRSGTTHLHYTLSCDPRFVTPRWHQVLLPQGFVLSWLLLRWFLVPFLSSKRPQDDVAYGPEWPAEDDFALNNWRVASSLPGRMILPRSHERWARFHNLEGLSERERERWRAAMWGWTAKMAMIARGRRILYKTPSHTGRVAELVRLFGPSVKFIHISRIPTPVVRSNVAMHARFSSYFLQDHPGDEAIRERIVDEYDRTERKFLEEAAALGPGRVAMVRYEDLVADPLGELRRIYDQLGLGWSPGLENRFAAYLRSVADYRTATQAGRADASKERTEATPPRLAWLIEAFGHDRPAAARVPVAAFDTRRGVGDRQRRGLLAAAAAAAVCAATWLVLARALMDRMDWLTWPVGVAIGLAALRAAGAGTLRLGLAAGALTVAVLLAISFPASYLVWYADRPGPTEWDHVWYSTSDGLLATNNLVWVVLGAMTAFRFASREHVRPPGMGG